MVFGAGGRQGGRDAILGDTGEDKVVGHRYGNDFVCVEATSVQMIKMIAARTFSLELKTQPCTTLGCFFPFPLSEAT